MTIHIAWVEEDRHAGDDGDRLLHEGEHGPLLEVGAEDDERPVSLAAGAVGERLTRLGGQALEARDVDEEEEELVERRGGAEDGVARAGTASGWSVPIACTKKTSGGSHRKTIPFVTSPPTRHDSSRAPSVRWARWNTAGLRNVRRTMQLVRAALLELTAAALCACAPAASDFPRRPTAPGDAALVDAAEAEVPAPLGPGARPAQAELDAPAGGELAPGGSAAAPETASESACNEQPPQELLIRSHFAFKIDASTEERLARKERHMRAIEYRTRRYGYVAGFGKPEWNRHEPVYYSDVTTFFGVRVRMHRRVIPALACVKAEIRRACAATPYEPHRLDGMRFRNTYHSSEITNHAYGIAIDIDPDRNSCCGCVPPLSEWPQCKVPSTSPFDRSRIPKCWVDVFTRYGFYWLGHDPMEDTMHFEFLGDPDRIVKRPAPGQDGARPALGG